MSKQFVKGSEARRGTALASATKHFSGRMGISSVRTRVWVAVGERGKNLWVGSKRPLFIPVTGTRKSHVVVTERQSECRDLVVRGKSQSQVKVAHL